MKPGEEKPDDVFDITVMLGMLPRRADELIKIMKRIVRKHVQYTEDGTTASRKAIIEELTYKIRDYPPEETFFMGVSIMKVIKQRQERMKAKKQLEFLEEMLAPKKKPSKAIKAGGSGDIGQAGGAKSDLNN